MLYFTLKYLHVIGATVLLGTGAGIAFFMLMAHRTGDPIVVAAVARIVVLADGRHRGLAAAEVLQAEAAFEDNRAHERCFPGPGGLCLLADDSSCAAVGEQELTDELVCIDARRAICSDQVNPARVHRVRTF